MSDERAPRRPDPTTRTDRWRDATKRVFLGGVAANALIAIVVILGAGGETDWRILGTSLLLTAASIVVIANAAIFERHRLGPVPLVAGVAAMAAAAMGIWAIWSDAGGDAWLRSQITIVVVSASGTYGGLISLPTLARPQRWVQWSAVALGALLGTLMIVGVWSDDTISAELWGVLAVLLASATIVVPVLSRSTGTDGTPVAPTPARVSFCPVCGGAVESVSGKEIECGACSTTFVITIHRTR